MKYIANLCAVAEIRRRSRLTYGRTIMVNDILTYMKIALVIVFGFFAYVFITQALNDATCASMERVSSPIIGKELIQFLALCWW